MFVALITCLAAFPLLATRAAIRFTCQLTHRIIVITLGLLLSNIRYAMDIFALEANKQLDDEGKAHTESEKMGVPGASPSQHSDESEGTGAGQAEDDSSGRNDSLMDEGDIEVLEQVEVDPSSDGKDGDDGHDRREHYQYGMDGGNMMQLDYDDTCFQLMNNRRAPDEFSTVSATRKPPLEVEVKIFNSPLFASLEQQNQRNFSQRERKDPAIQSNARENGRYEPPRLAGIAESMTEKPPGIPNPKELADSDDLYVQDVAPPLSYNARISQNEYQKRFKETPSLSDQAWLERQMFKRVVFRPLGSASEFPDWFSLPSGFRGRYCDGKLSFEAP